MLTSLLHVVAGWSSDNPVTVVCVAVTLVLVSTVALQYRRGQTSLGTVPKGLVRPPCLPWLPIVGTAPFMFNRIDDLVGNNFMKTLPEFFLRKSKQYGNVIAFYSMSRYTVVLVGRKAIYDALVKKAAAFADRRPMAAELLITNPHLNGFASSPFNNGLTKRRTITQLLLKELGYGKRAMELHIHDQLVRFIEDADAFEGKSFDPAAQVNQFAAGVILALLFGRNFEKTDPLFEHLRVFNDTWMAINAPMYDMVPLMRLLPRFRELGKSGKALSARLFELLRQEIGRCLSERKEDSFTFKYAEKEGSESVYSEDFLFIVRDLLIGGTDTTHHTIRWLLKMLANHNDLQQRLQAEVDDLYGTTERWPSIDDVSKLPLVVATMFETLRIETVAPFALPHQTLCDTEVNGYFIPKGTPVFINLFSGHMNPDDWESPNEFRPDRFIDSEGKLFDQERLIAFSRGKRACIGEQLARSEIFLFLASVLRHFNVLPPEGQSSVVTERMCNLVVLPSSFDIRMVRRQRVGDTAAKTG